MLSYRLSALFGQALDLGRERFLSVHPHSWLVLEASLQVEHQGRTPPRPIGTLALRDPLAAPLCAPPQSPRPGQLTLGRGPDCDLVLGEPSVSTLHLLLMQLGPDAWTVRDAASRNGTCVDGVRLLAGKPELLRDGTRLSAGAALLTFHDPAGLWNRLEAAAAGAPGLARKPCGGLG